ncbi:PaaI family thioesterase [Kribbella sp. NPDC048915]|uniref:PaaI family thioesterase n=1 Tax=Kribbella sp. NPDC048915 TaxID=3155148 RepID=UPI0033DD82E0
MELTFELAEKVLAAQPFSVLLGTRLTAFGDGAATLELTIREDLLQQNGFLHGGVLSYAADNAITFAGGAALGPDVLTGGFTISYLRPARGRLLRAEATVVHAGSRQATCTCRLLTFAGATDGFDHSADGSTDKGTLCAIAQGTVVARR